jgi:hypothetical protein
VPIRELPREHDERHRLDPARAFMRESLVWVIPLAAEGLGLVAYTWVDAHGNAGTAGIAFGPRLAEPLFERTDDIPVPDAMGFDDWKAGYLSFSHLKPLHRQSVRYEGPRMSLDFTFDSIHEPYAYSSHREQFPLYYADDRIEQGGRARGTVRIDGQDIEFDAPCHRDHSFGARAWGGTLHYKWINFLSDDASIHVMDLHGFGRTTARGYVYRDGEMAEILAVDFDFDLDADFYHRRLAATLTDDAGRTTTARLVSPTAELDYPISPRLRLFDIVGTAEIEGAPAVAYAEMAWPPDYYEANLGEGAAR